MEKLFSRGLFALYVSILIWLVLFKLTFHFSAILDKHARSLNLLPFAAPSMVEGRINYGEMVMNCVFFIPFGLLLEVNFKKPGFLTKLLIILAFSLSVELIQYLFAIGATDITDLIMNGFGGLLGLAFYALGNMFINSNILDRIVITLGALLFVFFVSMRLRLIIV